MQVCTSLQTDNHASTHPSVFYRPDALPAAQPTASKHWRLILFVLKCLKKNLVSIWEQLQTGKPFSRLHCFSTETSTTNQPELSNCWHYRQWIKSRPELKIKISSWEWEEHFPYRYHDYWPVILTLELDLGWEWTTVHNINIRVYFLQKLFSQHSDIHTHIHQISCSTPWCQEQFWALLVISCLQYFDAVG